MSSSTKKGILYDISIPSISEQIDNKLTEFTKDDLLIAIPARVLKVDEYETNQTVDVQSVIDLEDIDGRVLKASVIKKVFVKIPNGGGFSFKLPIAIGDLVTLHYSHKAISTWLDSEGSQLTQSKSFVAQERDCWVEHGFGTRKVNQAPSKTDLVIDGPATTITITPGGNVSIVTTGSSYLKASSHTIDNDVQINGNLNVTQTTTSDTVDATTSLLIDSKEIKNHNHAINSGSSAPGPTGPNN